MYLVQLLLPLYDNSGTRQPDALFHRVREQLTERFGGLTAYSRAPARGVWQSDEGGTSQDEIVVYEVMTKTLDRAWWHSYREELEQSFRQEQIVVRAQPIIVL
jgi:hypothetical protein